MLKHVVVAVVLLVLLGVAACGEPVVMVSDVDSIRDSPEIPSWAKVAPEQIGEAKKHGVPVAFENDLGMRFVLIPAGMFLMGRHGGVHLRSGMCDLGEVQREVTLTRPAYVQTTEATNAVFRRFRRGHDADAWKNEAGERGSTLTLNRDRQPATGVSWGDATAFASWLSKRDGVRSYRLPTDAEWEYACRAGTTTTYSVGQDLMRHQAAFRLETATDLGGAPGTIDVGSLRANPWGLYDMHGNVSEWCADWFGSLSDDLAVDPTGPPKGTVKVVRGGGAGTSATFCGSAVRQFTHVGFKSSGLASMMTGFRLVSPLPEKAQ